MTKSLPDTRRICLDCKDTKPVSEFHSRGVNAKGIKKYQSYCRPCANKRRRDREKKDPLFKEKRRKYMGRANSKRTLEKRRLEPSYSDYFKDIKRLYGLTKTQYYSLLDSQNNSCAICKVSFDESSKKKRPHIDHSHTTGKVRGILCGPCNMGIGQLKDSADLLESALNYLKNNQV